MLRVRDGGILPPVALQPAAERAPVQIPLTASFESFVGNPFCACCSRLFRKLPSRNGLITWDGLFASAFYPVACRRRPSHVCWRILWLACSVSSDSPLCDDSATVLALFLWTGTCVAQKASRANGHERLGEGAFGFMNVSGYSLSARSVAVAHSCR